THTMEAIPSEFISVKKNTFDCPLIRHRVVALDPGRYRRQYYWGLQKGELDLESPLNHIYLRADMVDELKALNWVLMPTRETLHDMHRMALYNATAAVQDRKHYLKAREYEYDFLPLHFLKRGRPSLYITRGTITKAIRAPYRTMPRIKSRVHPFFVAFMASDQLDMSAALVMPEKKARTLMDSVGDIVTCWADAPPSDFFVGPDVWKDHRHPLSDDGNDTQQPSRRSRECNGAQRAKLRRSTHAPCKQQKVAVATKPYTRCNQCLPCTKTSALPRPNVRSDDRPQKDPRAFADLRTWVDGVAQHAAVRPTRLDEDARKDAVLARYRLERARDAKNALDPHTNFLYHSGVVVGKGTDWAGYSSNNWASRVHGIRLMGEFTFH
ncbi:hypothetical protein HDZ31DRAFT_42115, partial [Schizophyllum fasciatum]